MLESGKSKKSEKLDEQEKMLNRKINTEMEKYYEDEEKEQEREEFLLENYKEDNFKYYFPKRFRSLCNEQGIKGVNAPDKFNISEATFSGYINGKRFPNRNEVKRLAKILGVSTNYLLGVTDNKFYLSPKMNMHLGLSEEARYYLYMFAHNLKSDVQDINADLPYDDENILFLETFNLFISDFSNFCDFLTYITKYVEVKQEINKLEKNKKIVLDYLGTKENLDDQLIRNSGKITKDNI